MKLLVCGSRTLGHTEDEYHFIGNCIADAIEWQSTDDMDTWLPPEDTVIISGVARGVDKVALSWAAVHWVTTMDFPADWDTYGKAAGPIRNQSMLDVGKPDKVLAIYDVRNGRSKSKGTSDMVGRAQKAGIPVTEVRYDPN